MRAGERLLRRKLKVHVVARVDHFVAGQHSAFELEDIIYLGFVNQFGHAVLMPFERKDGEIVPVGVCQHAGQDMVWPLQALPKSFTVTDAMRDALANAQSAPPVFDPQTTKGGRMTEQTQERAVRRSPRSRRSTATAAWSRACANRLREQKLVIGYQLVRPDDVVRASLNGIFDRLRDHHGDEVVFRGVPDSGGVAMTCFIGAR